MTSVTMAARESEYSRLSVRCVTRWTMTAEMTSRAEPWPSEMNQNWRVRRASPTVKPSSAAETAKAPLASPLAAGGGPPSTS